jgi:hypothetical protein
VLINSLNTYDEAVEDQGGPSYKSWFLVKS